MYFEPKELGGFLFNVYLRMFSDEDVSWMMSIRSSGKGEAQRQISRNSLVYHTRATFAVLLKRVKERVTTDWNLVMLDLIGRIRQDQTLLLGRNYIQDLFCQLHLLGVFSVETLRPDNLRLSHVRISGWNTIPPVIFISLVVPRQKLKVLENLPQEKLRSPLLQIEMHGPSFHNAFSSIQTAFGKLSDSAGPNQEPTLVFTEDPKGWAGSADLIVSIAVPTWTLSNEGVQLDASRQFIAEMSTKALITDPAEQTVLEAPSRVPVVPQQTSACRVTLKFGSVERFVQFPFPIDGDHTRLKIARKSHYIEVTAFPCSHNSPFFSSLNGFNVNKFPVLFNGPIPTVWNIHRVHLARLPVTNLGNNAHLLKIPLNCMTSEYERKVIRGGEDPRRSKPLTEVKESLQVMFARFTGIQAGAPVSVFSLQDPVEGGENYAVLFFSAFRLDLSSHSFILDGHVLPITKTLPKQVLDDLYNSGMSVNQVTTVGQETLLWRQLIHAFVERCRQTWTHQTDCEYIKIGQVPPSYAMGESFICHCGRGKDVDGMLRKKEWKKYAPFSTRIAVSPLYAVSYMETVIGNLFTEPSQTPKKVQKDSAEEVSKKLDELSLSEVNGESCQKCGSSGDLLACSRCKIKYCSKTCQLDDWKAHKRFCRQP
ncbi:hypothetical protein GYMLUDRAFT_248965 [Collybiopsis luxurians FD-317 M1]|uniref:Unplaced genomic scaffold GYMLUscaffold_61, whole genome shotgun sequence n=1 Tax=Collybiopsis luxurians FD-317 M1 TaxID=944289 RepID=A0A0D0BKC1_9AGAR|nr:hypothetical protein GYMLUDRAFT_248965 [Collybiopsis luxurians FD-317 M1]